MASGASARVAELEWLHPDANSVSEFRIEYGTSSGNYEVEFSIAPPAPTNGVYRHDLVVPDEQSIYAAVIAVGPTGLESVASNEVLYPGLPSTSPPPAPAPAPPPPPAAPPPPPEPKPSLPPQPESPAAGSSVYRINVGGPGFIDPYGQEWEADWTPERYFGLCACSHPDVDGVDVANTDLPELYRRERTQWNAGESMPYELPIESGDYVVRLHFAETAGYGRAAFGPGERQFDVRAEGAVVLKALDIAQEAGVDRALVKEFVVSVRDGALSLGFDHIGRGEPRISAIEVLTVEAPAPTDASVYRINVGGPAFVDQYDRVWEADWAPETYFGPCACSHPDVDGTDVANTDLPELYWRQRTQWNAGESMPYELPIESGDYVVRLHFAETASYGRAAFGPGERQFDVRAEGTVVLKALDIAQEAGVDQALVKELVVTVRDGALSLGFEHIGRGEPRISAIEVLAVEAPVPTPTDSSVYRINVGGPSFVDPYDRLWEADWTPERYFGLCACSHPEVDGADLANTDLPELYRRQRTQWNAGESMPYELPIEPGDYVVRLHFAETAAYGRAPFASGERQFDVRAEGAVLLRSLDIAQEVGVDQALVKEFVVSVSDGALSLGFDHIGRGEPRVSAIEVLTAGGR